jgi:hypothetical protein
MTQPGHNEVLVIACGAIARELLRIQKLNHWYHVDFQCLPPELHNHPDQLPAAVAAKIEAAADSYRKIFVAFGDCGTAGKLDDMLERYGTERIPGAHCYEFLAGSDAFEALAEAEPGTFYLTDFLVRHFNRLVVKGLGMDRLPQLKSTYFRNYKRLVYLAQSDSEVLQQLARHHAQYLGLDYIFHNCSDLPLERVLTPALTQPARCKPDNQN